MMIGTLLSGQRTYNGAVEHDIPRGWVLALTGKRQQMRKTLRCYAEGRGDQWEAICLDLDIAVQGSCFEEVYHDLGKAITSYLEYVLTLPKEEQAQFLQRTAPLSLQLKFLWGALRATVCRRGTDDRRTRAEFLVPLVA